MLLLALPGGRRGWEGSCQSGFSRNPGDLRSGNISCIQPEVRVNREEPVEGGGGGSKGERERGAQQAHGGPRAVCLPVHPSPPATGPPPSHGSQGARRGQPAHRRGRCCCSDVQEEVSWEVSPTKRPLPTSTSPECTWASRALSHLTSHRPGSQQE